MENINKANVIVMESYKPLFTKANWIFFCREMIKMLSNQDSYFSKKRCFEAIAFIILQWGMVHWLIKNIDKCGASDLWVWATVECFICGYQLNQIQKEKNIKNEIIKTDNTDTTIK